MGRRKPIAGYTTEQVVSRLGIARTTLIVWTKRGYVTPLRRGERGRGHNHVYSRREVARVRLIRYYLSKVKALVGGERTYSTGGIGGL